MLNSNSNRFGAGSVLVRIAVIAMARCALLGGLYDESRMNSVRGPAPRTGSELLIGGALGLGEVIVEGGLMERIILKGVEVDCWKDLREASRVGRRDRVWEIREAISDILGG